MKNYADITISNITQDNSMDVLKQVVTVLKQICRFRNSEDVGNFNNLNKIFVLGRTTARVPSSSTDVITGDLVGDFCPTATFLYILVANSGSPVWRRITMGAF